MTDTLPCFACGDPSTTRYEIPFSPEFSTAPTDHIEFILWLDNEGRNDRVADRTPVRLTVHTCENCLEGVVDGLLEVWGSAVGQGLHPANPPRASRTHGGEVLGYEAIIRALSRLRSELVGTED